MNSIPQKAGRREWLGLVVLALPCLLYAMDLSVLDLAVPRLVAALGPTSSELLWIVDVYGFVLAGSLVTMGTLGDRIGRRRLLLTGAAAFGAVSVLAAFSTSARMLIATRALLGLAGATLAPSTLSLIHAMFVDPRQRMTAVSVWGASFSAGSALGPVLGGLVLERLAWGTVFLLSVPVMALLLTTGRALLPEVKTDGGRLDLPSAALSLGAVLLAIYGVKELARSTGGSLPALVVAGVLGVTFVRRQRRLPDPLIDLRMFRERRFSVALLTNVSAVFVAFGLYMFLAQYLQLVLGLSPLHAAYCLLPSAAGFAVGAMGTPGIARRVRPVVVVAGGLAVSSAGVLGMAQLSGLEGLVAGSIVFALGLAPVSTLAASMVIDAAPAERVGAASAISETSSELGGALGIALLGSLGTAVYRAHLGAGAPPEAGTLAGAVALASKLPTDRAAALLAASRAAFERSYQIALGTSAALLLATAVLVVLALRNEESRAAVTIAAAGA